MNKYFSLGAIVAVGIAIWLVLPMSKQEVSTSGSGDPIVEVRLPQSFSVLAELGREKFEANCAACHGTNAVGKDGIGPPLVHVIYEPNHHGDESFQLAAAQGVRQHHWSFGNMPAVQGITRDEVSAIITYVRELQRANGIN